MDQADYTGTDSDVSRHASANGVLDSDPRVGRILQCIETHLDNPSLGCDMLQKMFFVSRPTLYRMFQPLGGVSRYIRERRLATALHRLREEPQHTITWLLYDLGFESERQFQRAFLARYGISPNRWRAQAIPTSPRPERPRLQITCCT